MKYKITLPSSDRLELVKLTSSGTISARVMKRAQVLLLSDRSQGECRSNNAIMEALGVSETLILSVRKRYDEEGLKAALYERPRPGAVPKITGDVEAKIVAIACSDPPDGHAKWTVRLIADKVVELEMLDSISHVSVHGRLKKTLSSLGKSHPGA